MRIVVLHYQSLWLTVTDLLSRKFKIIFHFFKIKNFPFRPSFAYFVIFNILHLNIPSHLMFWHYNESVEHNYSQKSTSNFIHFRFHYQAKAFAQDSIRLKFYIVVACNGFVLNWDLNKQVKLTDRMGWHFYSIHRETK